jgi:hypothetical protein
VCILIVSCSVFLNWVCWARGNFSGEPGHVHILLCGSLRCVECRAGTSIFWALCWCDWRDCTGFLFLWLCFGGYGTIEQVGVAGQYGFSSFPGSVLAGTVRLKWWGGCCVSLFTFLSLLSVFLGGWICAVGILRFIFYGICSGFLRFLIFQLLIVDNLLQEVSENSAP